MEYYGDRALELLRIGTGNPDAAFRAGQAEAIQYVVENRGRLLLVQRAGWGKSFVYFIATKLLRDQGLGPALLISPLLALMRNQINAAQRMGVNAETINSDNRDRWDEIEDRINSNQVDVLMISPERLANQEFIDEVLGSISSSVSMLVVDEAHCVSDWGHDFRPDYRRIERIQRNLPRNLPLLATTATVNNRVMEDLQELLGSGVQVTRGDLALPSVTLQTIRMPNRAERFAWLAETIPTLNGSGIVYTLTVRDAERVAEWLRSRGINALAYYGGQTDRPELEQKLLDNQVKCLVATTALGMGFDKPDLSFVVHHQTPGSVAAYYQQVGRAGRGIDSAYGVLLGGSEDAEINDYFITSAFPTREEAGAILEALENAPRGLSILEIQAQVNVSSTRAQIATKILALEEPPPIVKEGSKWVRTPASLSESFWERVDRLTGLRRSEELQMREYLAKDSGHMEFLVDAMDEKLNPVVDRRLLPQLPTYVQRQTVADAIEFLRRAHIQIVPRKRWPTGAYKTSAAISGDRRAEEGRALCLYGDAGWGRLVQTGKYREGKFADELVDACVNLIDHWAPEPSPTWVACVPSSRNRSLVPEFASRLAQRLGLEFRLALTAQRFASEQKEMNNSAFKVNNVAGSLTADPNNVDAGPVLLIDDVVDSGWTFAVAAWMLRDAGCGPVWPLALASKGNR